MAEGTVRLSSRIILDLEDFDDEDPPDRDAAVVHLRSLVCEIDPAQYEDMGGCVEVVSAALLQATPHFATWDITFDVPADLANRLTTLFVRR